MKLREYQEAANFSLYEYFVKNRQGNPIVAIPTGAGKSVIIASFLKDTFSKYRKQKIVIASHVKEIIEQNHAKLIAAWPAAPAGIYAASIKRKDISPITFVSIQTVAMRYAEFGHVDLLLIDECHLVGTKEDTLYLQFINGLKEQNPKLRVVGYTATPFRLGLGMLTDGNIFDDIAFDLTERHEFNKLVAQGYLVPFIAKHTQTQLDVSNVGKSGGEYIQKELQDAVDKAPITAAALQETIALASDRKHWLIFAAGLSHAAHIESMLKMMGISAATIDGKMTTTDRDTRIRDFKLGKTRALINFGVLTTGFDFPSIDCIVMLRPTSSPALWVQMVGRGGRPAPDKTNCLVLDFAGNTRRLGPINDPVIPARKGSKGGGIAPVRLCPECSTYSHASSSHCDQCGYLFPKIIRIDVSASTDRILADDLPSIVEFNVDEVNLFAHHKEGKPDSLRVEYRCGLRVFKEWVCFEHHGYPRVKAEAWWRDRSPVSPPDTINEAILAKNELNHPKTIRVWVNSKHQEILAHGW
jgi:DNA repair protein RadD